MKRTHDRSRTTLEEAIARLLLRAACYNGVNGSINDTSGLLSAAREYGRALNRVENMRGRK